MTPKNVSSRYLTSAFVGRREEIKALATALGTVEGGLPRCILLQGEAGIGKSRLIAEVEARAVTRGFTVLTGRCFAQDRSFPYAPLVDMLRPFLTGPRGGDRLDALGSLAPALVKLLPQLAPKINLSNSSEIVDAKIEKRRLFTALLSLFLREADKGPLLLVLEDLHWSDEASLEFLLYLARRVVERPILLLLSTRTAAGQPGFVELLAELDREPVAQEIRLTPLTRVEVAALLQAILDQVQEVSAEFVDALYRLTEGNPFFVEEICTSLIASGDIYFADNQWRRRPLAQIDIPDSLQRMVEQRLEQISHPARQLIDLAAVSGRSFDFAVLQMLTGQDDEALLALVKELMAARLVVEVGADRFAFRHALTREALYVRLLVRERQRLHRQLVEAIEAVHVDSVETQLEALAYHAFAGTLWPKALDYASRAGERALALYAPHAAVEQFTRAVQAAGQLAVAPGSRLYRLRGRAFDTLGNFEGARDDYEAALSAARAAGEQQVEWQTLLDLGLLWASRDYDRAGDYCRQALALARTLQEPLALGHSLNRMGNWLMNSGQPLAARDYHREALALFEIHEDSTGIARTLDLLAMTSNMCGDYVSTVNYYERAIPILRQLNDRRTLASSLTMLSIYRLDETLVREALELARAIDWRAGEAFALQYLGQVLAYRGDYGQGLVSAQRGLELAEVIKHHQWQVWGHIVLGLIYLELLAVDKAYLHLQRGRDLATDVGSSFMLTFATSLLISTFILQNRLDEAASLLPERLPDPLLGADYGLLKAGLELCLARRDSARALQILDQQQLPAATEWRGAMAYFYAIISQLRGEALTRFDRLDEAETALQSALQLCHEQRLKMGLWRIQIALGKLYRAAGDSTQAAVALAAARALIEESAATVTDVSLKETFQRRAIAIIPPAPSLTPRQAAKEKYGGLTRREREVAAVVVRGLSNQDIADELVISVKTVEAHITRILSKLGFSSRAQVAVWAVEKGLASAPQDLDSQSPVS